MRAAVQLLLVQACGEVHAVHASRMPAASLTGMLDVLEALSAHARRINDDMGLRRALAYAQAEDQASRPPRSITSCVRPNAKRPVPGRCSCALRTCFVAPAVNCADATTKTVCRLSCPKPYHCSEFSSQIVAQA